MIVRYGMLLSMLVSVASHGMVTYGMYAKIAAERAAHISTELAPVLAQLNVIYTTRSADDGFGSLRFINQVLNATLNTNTQAQVDSDCQTLRLGSQIRSVCAIMARNPHDVTTQAQFGYITPEDFNTVLSYRSEIVAKTLSRSFPLGIYTPAQTTRIDAVAVYPAYCAQTTHILHKARTSAAALVDHLLDPSRFRLAQPAILPLLFTSDIGQSVRTLLAQTDQTIHEFRYQMAKARIQRKNAVQYALDESDDELSESDSDEPHAHDMLISCNSVSYP